MWEKNRMTWSSCSCASQSVHWLFGANGCIYMGFIQSAPTYTVNSHAGSGPLGFSIRTLQHADTVGSNHPTLWLVYNPLCLLTHGPCFYKKQNKKKQKKHTGCTDCQALKLGELCVMEIHLSIRLDHPLNGQKKTRVIHLRVEADLFEHSIVPICLMNLLGILDNRGRLWVLKNKNNNMSSEMCAATVHWYLRGERCCEHLLSSAGKKTMKRYCSQLVLLEAIRLHSQ